MTERLDHFMFSITCMNRTLTLGRPPGQPHYYKTISYLVLFLFIHYFLYRLYTILNFIKNFPFKNKFPDMLDNSKRDLSWLEMNEQVIKTKKLRVVSQVRIFCRKTLRRRTSFLDGNSFSFQQVPSL